MKIIKNPSQNDWTDLCKRPTSTIDEIENTVAQIFLEVKQKGDKAIKKYTSFFDRVQLEDMLVPSHEFEIAEEEVPESLKKAIQLAMKNIKKFHASQAISSIKVETMDGVSCWVEKKPIEKIGLYIPGGTAPLFSSILMLAVPARLAGCKEIVLFTPPGKEGRVDPAILYTSKLCGVKKVYTVGGIQAIAAMTFGTETIPAVYKIFGPGNQFVTVAKQFATKYGVAIDMPAGPSELLVAADDTANPDFIAADLLSQAEHGIDSQVVLVSTSEKLIIEVQKAVARQVQDLPRKQIADEALLHSKWVYLKNEKEVVPFINTYAPEHLIICMKNESEIIDNIENAGSVFIGDYSPEAAGDYASGTNHTLPTNGFSKAYSGVNLDSFLKSISFQKITREGLQNIGPSIELMALAEGLEAHKNAISIRLKNTSNE